MENSPNLLTCVALSPRAPAVVRDALRVAALLELRPMFLHVGRAGDEARQRVSAILRQAGGAGDEELLFRTGLPADVICSAAKETGSRMIVMGALDRDPPMTRIWGSVARQVARNAPCSVMLLPDPGDRQDVLGRIVVGIKMDDESAAMVRLGLRLGKAGAEDATGEHAVHFVHEFSIVEARWATSGDRGRAGEFRGIDEYIRQRRREDQRMLRDYLSAFDAGGVAMRAASLPGHEGMEIVAYAREHRADLLVLPTPYRRLTIWDRFFHHPTELALRQLPCGLLLYREPSVSPRRWSR